MIGTDAFVDLARATAATRGVPNLPLAVVPHPLGGVEPERIRARAEAIVDEILAALTTPPPTVASSPRAPRDVVAAPDDLDAFQDFAVARGWSDGLPVMPPTPERVARVLGARDAATVVATLAPSGAPATQLAIAVNAALAGARGEHLAVVIAAVRAVADPAFNLDAVQATTHPCTPLVVVNGPIATRLGIAAGPNALGNGHRANAVIGRALRLVLQNVGGARPGGLDRATLGHPGKFTYCLAEHEAVSPWPPLSVDRGFRPDQDCVTVAAAEAPHNINDHGSTSADALVCALAGTMATTGNNNVYLGGNPLVLVGPEHAATIAASGWSKADLRRVLWERAAVPLAAFSAENLARFAVIDPSRFADADGRLDAVAHVCHTPDDLLIVVAGGPGKHSAFVPTFGATRCVTTLVEP